MKKLFVLLSLVLSFSAFGAPSVDTPAHMPFKKSTNSSLDSQAARITVLEAGLVAPIYTADGVLTKHIARATYDVAVNLGTIAPHSLGVALPAKAIITQAYFYIVTQFVDAGAGTVAFHCEDAGNIFTAADITGITPGTITAGNETGAASAMVGGIASACNITATVAGAAQTAGKAILYVEYVIAE